VRILADNALMEALIGALLLMLPIALIESAILVRFVSARTKGVSTVTRAIVHGDLSRRIEIIGAHDEFDHLAGLLNRTFDWLEMLIEDLNFVTNALAHELRSPLTRVRAELEKLGSARSAERTLLIQQISSDIDGMLRIISATLDLSRAETGTAATFTRFDMHRLIIDLYEVYDASAEERGVELVLAQCDEAECFGNPELIAQAVSNLLDNALRHSGATRVELGCSNQHPGWLLWVADNGVGIPEHDRAEAVRKFGRLDRARTTQGSGLGLAFVSAVAKIHGGELRLEDNRPGLRATLTLRPGPPPGASAS
jgi:signal transduction histidine kinase